MEKAKTMKPFNKTLTEHNIRLTRGEPVTLQINMGLLCNQNCGHCHLNAGPGRKEIMTQGTMEDVVAYARRCNFKTIDITGGAPELNPNISYLIENLSLFAPKIMIRTNLSALDGGKRRDLIKLLKEHRVVIVASFSSINKSQLESQRGDGIFETSIEALRWLNSEGYGKEGTGLDLHLVSNPTGAFLPPTQSQTEKRFRQVLEQKWGIFFNSLFSFANVPLGKYRDWLMATGNFDKYMEKLAANFNPCAVDGLMCRTQVSVSWDGFLYDCDFNLAAGLLMNGKRIHVSEALEPPAPGSHIPVSDFCYTCTAGVGFT